MFGLPIKLPNVLLLVGVIGVLAISYFSIEKMGSAKYDAGLHQGQIECMADQASALNESELFKNKEIVRVKNMDNDNVDAALRDNGWLRGN